MTVVKALFVPVSWSYSPADSAPPVVVVPGGAVEVAVENDRYSTLPSSLQVYPAVPSACMTLMHNAWPRATSSGTSNRRLHPLPRLRTRSRR